MQNLWPKESETLDSGAYRSVFIRQPSESEFYMQKSEKHWHNHSGKNLESTAQFKVLSFTSGVNLVQKGSEWEEDMEFQEFPWVSSLRRKGTFELFWNSNYSFY
jgi:hypothetical protein